MSRPSELFIYSAVAQNPGRVVTLVHKEDWDAFSESVSMVPSRCMHLDETLTCVHGIQDPFPDDDVVWGTLRCCVRWTRSESCLHQAWRTP